MNPSFPALLTPRLQLREITHDDVPALLSVFADAEAMRWFGTDPVCDQAQMAQVVSLWQGWRQLPNPGTRWGIALREGGPLLGTCGLFAWNRGWRRCTLGYELGRAAWGHGYMQEALQAVLAWGFDDAGEGMALNRIEAMIHPHNKPSLRLVERLGFRREGLLREVAFWGGRHQDLEMHALLAREHQAAASSTQRP